MEKILMGSIVGFTAFTLVSYILIILKVPILIIPATLITAYLLYKPILKEVKNIKMKFNRQTLIILVVFMIGIAGQLAVISPSGSFKNGDLLFWSSNGHDGMWHIALMEEFKKGYPFQNPVFAGEKLVNYHFFSDIAPAIISKYSPISDLDLYFRIFPLIYSLFLGVSAYFLTKKITNNFSSGIWAVIFTYFAGSFGYFIGKGESVFWATQIQSASGNPPQIVSDFLVLTFFYFVFSYLKSKNWKLLITPILILGTLAEFKVYAAIVLLGATFLSGLWQITIPAGIIAAALYLPNSTGGTSFLIFQPWWYIRTMIVEPSRLNWLDEELKRQTYIADHNWKRVISIEVVSFLIFFFGNLGMRFIGLWDFVKYSATSFKNRFNLLFISTILISLILPLLFLQKGVASNTSQFFQYFILLFGILAGISVSKLMKIVQKPWLQILAGVILIALMIPTQYGLLKDFYGRTAFAKISKDEISALDFLSKNSPADSVILTAPMDKVIRETAPTPDIWAWADTGYVAALSGRREYFADKEQVDIMGYNFAARGNLEKKVFESVDENEVRSLIKSSGAGYIYFPVKIAPKLDLAKLGLQKIFADQAVEIWKI